MIAKLATEASSLVRDRKVDNIPNAIRQVLANHNLGRSPDMYSKIASELGARGARKKQMGRNNRPTINAAQRDMARDDYADLQALEREQMFRDARAHELRQPADAYDVEAEERVRKPLREEDET